MGGGGGILVEENTAGARGGGGVLSGCGTFLRHSYSALIWFCRLVNLACAFGSSCMS